MVQDPIFWKVLGNTFYLAGGSIIIRLGLALALALILNQKIAGRDAYRSIIFSPTFTTGAAVALVLARTADRHDRKSGRSASASSWSVRSRYALNSTLACPRSPRR